MSTTTYGPPVSIDGPPPVPRPFGLYSVSIELGSESFPIAEEFRAAMGVHVHPYPPETPEGHDPCSEGTFRQKSAGSEIPVSLFGGFTAQTPITCTRRGVGVDAVFVSKARRALEATDQFIAEEQLVRGVVLPLNPFLGASGSSPSSLDLISSAGWKISRAIFELEDRIAATGRGGVIGLTPGAAAQAGMDLLRVVNGHWETVNGTPVFAAAGFVGKAPVGQSAPADGKEWAWAMGQPFHWRGEPYVPGDRGQNLDRVQNTQTYRAERELVVGWDGILRAAVLVDSAA